MSNGWKEKLAKVRLTPRNDWVVVSQDEIEKTQGGIYMPETSQARASTGIVMYVGPAVDGIGVGDRVLYGQFDGMTVILDAQLDSPVVVLKEDCIRAVIGGNDGNDGRSGTPVAAAVAAEPDQEGVANAG